MAKTDEQSYTIHNIDGVQDLVVDLREGVNVLVGPMGAGKSCARRAIARAAGDKSLSVGVRDGAEKGTVIGPGGLVLTVGARTTTTGTPLVALADHGAVADLIEPSGKERKTQEKNRFAALLQVVDIKVGEPGLLALSGAVDAHGEPVEPDEDQTNIVAGVQAKLGDEAEAVDVAKAAQLVKLATEGQARFWEGKQADLEALAKSGKEELDALTNGGDVETPTHSVAELEGLLEDATRSHERLQGRAEQATETSTQLEQLEAEVGEETFDQLTEKHAELTVELQGKQDDLARISEEVRLLEIEIARVRERGRSAKRLVELRGQLSTAPADAALAEAAEAIEARRRELKQAQEWERIDELTRGAAQRAVEIDEVKARAERVRNAALTMGRRVGRILFDQGVPGLTYDNDQLHVFDESTGAIGEPVHRLSLGQRTTLALELATQFCESKTLPLDPGFWLGLTPKNQRRLAKEAAQHGLYILTERPDDVSEISIEHLGDDDMDVPHPNDDESPSAQAPE